MGAFSVIHFDVNGMFFGKGITNLECGQRKILYEILGFQVESLYFRDFRFDESRVGKPSVIFDEDLSSCPVRL